MKNVRFYWARLLGESLTTLFFYQDKGETEESLQYMHVAQVTPIEELELFPHANISDKKLVLLFTALAVLITSQLKLKKSLTCQWHDQNILFSVHEFVNGQSEKAVAQGVFMNLCMLYLKKSVMNTEQVLARILEEQSN